MIGNDMEKQNHRIMVRIITTWRRLKEPSRMKEATNKLFWVMHSFLLWWRAGSFRANQTGHILIQVKPRWNSAEVSKNSFFSFWFTRFPRWTGWNCGTMGNHQRLLVSCREQQKPLRWIENNEDLNHRVAAIQKKITPCHANNNLRARA